MNTTTLTTLAENPDNLFQVKDNVEAERLLSELGIIAQFAKPDHTHARIESVVYNEHSTHHILALRLSGCAEAADNGYLIYCIPKSQVTQPDFLVVARETLKEFGAKPNNLSRLSRPATTA